PLSETSTTATVINLRPGALYEFQLDVTGGKHGGSSNTVDVETSAPKLRNLELYWNDQKLDFTFNPGVADQGEVIVDVYEFLQLKLVADFDPDQFDSVTAENTSEGAPVEVDLKAETVLLPIDFMPGPNEIKIVATDNNNNVTEYSF